MNGRLGILIPDRTRLIGLLGNERAVADTPVTARQLFIGEMPDVECANYANSFVLMIRLPFVVNSFGVIPIIHVYNNRTNVFMGNLNVRSTIQPVSRSNNFD